MRNYKKNEVKNVITQGVSNHGDNGAYDPKPMRKYNQKKQNRILDHPIGGQQQVITNKTEIEGSKSKQLTHQRKGSEGVFSTGLGVEGIEGAQSKKHVMHTSGSHGNIMAGARKQTQSSIQVHQVKQSNPIFGGSSDTDPYQFKAKAKPQNVAKPQAYNLISGQAEPTKTGGSSKKTFHQSSMSNIMGGGSSHTLAPTTKHMRQTSGQTFNSNSMASVFNHN